MPTGTDSFGPVLWQASLYARACSNVESKDGGNHKASGFSHMSQDFLPWNCRGRKGEETGGGTRIIMW